MALSVDKLLTDAHTLVIHLKDHDTLADTIIAATQTLLNKVEAMKQYQDDITELNEIAKHRPRSTLVLGIAQENRQIRELQQENRELQAALEEHQSALELIMQKYREHTVKLIQSNRLERALHERENADKESMCHLMDKIDEMAGVMQKAIEVDETLGCADKERLTRLEVENKALREMLEICTTSKEKIIPHEIKIKERKNDVDDDDDENTDTECDSTILVSPDKKVEEKEGEEKNKKKPSGVGSKEGTPVPSKDSTLTGSKESTPVSTTKTANTSKSTGDVRKGKATPTSKPESGTSTIKKTSSSTVVKKESPVPALKKSPSTDTKRDIKSKVAAKSIGKK